MRKFSVYSLIIFLVVLSGCSANYRIISQINSDGFLNREIYAYQESNTTQFNHTDSPFIFKISDGWKVKKMSGQSKLYYWGDTVRFNIVAERSGDLLKGSKFFVANDNWQKPLAEPHESLVKTFRWFYTYYNYTCRYSEIPDRKLVDLNKYLTPQEQRLLLRGDLRGYLWMNGLELKDEMDHLSNKFQNWYYRAIFEVIVEQFDYQLKLNKMGQLRLDILLDKEKLYAAIKKNEKYKDCESPLQFCHFLDTYYKTTAFDLFYEKHKAQIDLSFEERTKIIDCLVLE